jgi:hypothetical protein
MCRRCGHGPNPHGHYDHRTNCVLCDCPAWRKPRGSGWLARLFRR